MEIECARCGAYFHYELTHCPACGVNIYDTDGETDHETREEAYNTPNLLENILTRLRSMLRRFSNKPYLAEEVFGDSLDQAILYDELLMKVGGDHATVERLIDYEQLQEPNSVRKTWIKNAIERWERDNRIGST